MVSTLLNKHRLRYRQEKAESADLCLELPIMFTPLGNPEIFRVTLSGKSAETIYPRRALLPVDFYGIVVHFGF